jgi:hypothetical protein
VRPPVTGEESGGNGGSLTKETGTVASDKAVGDGRLLYCATRLQDGRRPARPMGARRWPNVRLTGGPHMSAIKGFN